MKIHCSGLSMTTARPHDLHVDVSVFIEPNTGAQTYQVIVPLCPKLTRAYNAFFLIPVFHSLVLTHMHAHTRE